MEIANLLMAHYSWIKAVHIVGVICWMAGLFYLPRLFVYHAQNYGNEAFVSVVKLQEYKLFAYIMRPAMWISVLSGALMLWIAIPDIFRNGMWIHIKILFVVFMLIFHIVCGILVARMQSNLCKISHKFFRIFNEIPTILMIVIVICAVVKF